MLEMYNFLLVLCVYKDWLLYLKKMIGSQSSLIEIELFYATKHFSNSACQSCCIYIWIFTDFFLGYSPLYAVTFKGYVCWTLCSSQQCKIEMDYKGMMPHLIIACVGSQPDPRINSLTTHLCQTGFLAAGTLKLRNKCCNKVAQQINGNFCLFHTHTHTKNNSCLLKHLLKKPYSQNSV